MLFLNKLTFYVTSLLLILTALLPATSFHTSSLYLVWIFEIDLNLTSPGFCGGEGGYTESSKYFYSTIQFSF